jgi:hypothetical protein
MSNPTLHVRWTCPACREGGLLPRLDDSTVDTMRDAITRGHERRSPVCHRTRGTRRIAFLLDGVTHRFGASDFTPSPNPPITQEST